MRIYIILALLLVVSACTTASTPTNYRTFVGGTEGVSLAFETEAPPSEVIAGDPFFVVVILENLGEHTVEAGDYTVELKGFSPVEFGVGSADDLIVTPDEDLVANSLDPDSGEILESYPVYIQVPTEGELFYDGTIAGNTEFPFVAEVCYQYETTANGQLCIKSDLQKPNDADVCTINGAKAVSSSGGPIQISDLKEFAGGPDAVRFTFKVIAASTGGEVSELASGCDDSFTHEERVLVNIDTGMSGNLRCTGFVETISDTEGVVKLSGGSRQVTCTQDVLDSEKSDYVKAITITAEYDYQQATSTSLLVKPIIT